MEVHASDVMFSYSRNSVAKVFAVCGIKYNVPGFPKKKFVNNMHVFVLCMCVCVSQVFHNILLYFSLFNVKIKMELVKKKKKKKINDHDAVISLCVWPRALAYTCIQCPTCTLTILMFTDTSSLLISDN